VYFPLDLFRKYRLGQLPGGSAQQGLDEICKNIPDNLLLKHVSAVIPSYTHFFAFKRQFLNQLAVTSLVGHLLGIGNRTPHNLMFSKSTGNIIQLDFFPVFNGEVGLVKTAEAVPFRLTRNLQMFFNQVHIDGSFNGTMTGTALCLNHHKDQLRHQLGLFIHDNLIDWHVQHNPNHDPSSTAPADKKADMELRRKVLGIVDSNVDSILTHITSLVPSVTELEKTKFTLPLNKKISELIDSAQSVDGISMMDPSWMPWI